MNSQPQIDLTKTTAITDKTGNQVWQQGFLLRKVSKFLLGTNEDAIIPIPFWFNAETGEIFDKGINEDIKEILFTDEIKEELRSEKD